MASKPVRKVFLKKKDSGGAQYRVVKAINLTDPPVGHWLTEKEVDALIADGIYVVIHV